MGITITTRRAALAAGCAGLAALAIAVPSAVWARPGVAHPNYLSLAEQGVKHASAWANHQFHWYNAVLQDHAKRPEATTVDAVPLFEAIDYLALAHPSAANKQAVVKFANHAERYWDPAITPAPGSTHKTPAWGIYPSDHTNVQIYFDANAWWSLAFLDAYTVTHSSRYLHDAERDFKFIAGNGWDAADAGGFWRDNRHSTRAGDALAASADLAARLYAVTKQPSYLTDADNWIVWADAHLLKSNGTYAAPLPHSLVMPHDGEGAMLDAFTALCASGAAAPGSVGSWCSRAESFAAVTLNPHNAFFPLNAGPQIDCVYARGLLSLYDLDHKSRWYKPIAKTATRILSDAREPNGLFLRAWSGSSKVPASMPNMLRTHASSVSVLAALAAAPPPA